MRSENPEILGDIYLSAKEQLIGGKITFGRIEQALCAAEIVAGIKLSATDHYHLFDCLLDEMRDA